MRELNLLESFPKSVRKIEKGWRTEENKRIAREFGKDFFDGERVNGYGGYYYEGRWKEIAKKLQKEYNLNSESSILDIGCAKGFLLYDLQELIPGIKIAGMDISSYAINHAMDGYGNYLLKKSDIEDPKKLEEIARNKIIHSMVVGSADNLPYADNSFDVVLSINTAHNLPNNLCGKAIDEMLRVGKDNKKMFIQLDAYRNKEEKERMDAWGITCITTMYDSEWLDFLKNCGYDGDYFWTLV